MLSKEKVYTVCRQIVNDKISFLKQTILELKEGGENDAKSSAGDKHETARAMLQGEQEKLSHQLSEVLLQKLVFEKINPAIQTQRIAIGSLIKTDKGYLFIAAALGKINVDNTDVITLSPQSPLGEKLMGLLAGETASINNVHYRIEWVG